LFCDLDPQAGGTISWRQLADHVAITFQAVPESSQAPRNSFQIEIFWDGTLRLTWLEIGATSGIVGLSRGGGVPEGFVESDLTGYARCAPPLTLRVPTRVRESDGVLTGQGQLIVPAAANTDLIFFLAPS